LALVMEEIVDVTGQRLAALEAAPEAD
jgi:hypothetical protein